MTDLNLAVMGILDMADLTLKYAQQSIFQNGPLFCKGWQMCEMIQIEGNSYTLRSQEYMIYWTFMAVIMFSIKVRMSELFYKDLYVKNSTLGCFKH